MNNFSTNSLNALETCDTKLQFLFHTILQTRDCTIIQGVRFEDSQMEAYNSGKSKLKFPESKHNSIPSRAVDVAPYIDGKARFDDRNCLYFAGFVLGVAKILGINIRCGFDWDIDGNVNDQKFNDGVHFELIDEE